MFELLVMLSNLVTFYKINCSIFSAALVIINVYSVYPFAQFEQTIRVSIVHCWGDTKIT